MPSPPIPGLAPVARRSRPHSTLLAGAAVLLATLAAPGLAAAAPKDAQAEKALNAAMESDYLETRFDDAETKLRAALERCGDAGCSKAVKVRLYLGLGTVLAGGMSKPDDAKRAFVEALRLDATAKPDPALVQADISAAFDQARAEVASGQAARVQHKPAPEHEFDRPLPIYVELAPDLPTDGVKVTLVYQAPGSQEWITADMRALRDRGYGAEIPCADVGKQGVVRYHVEVVGPTGETLASSGSSAAPNETILKRKVDAPAPHWPGYAPPEACKSRDASLAQCVDATECNAGLACVEGRCVVPGAEGEKARPEPEAPGFFRRKSWISASFILDTSVLVGDDVCSVSGQNDKHFVCMRSDASRYNGTPTLGNGDTVTGGWGLSTMRAVLGYDRFITSNISVGGRVGLAFNGASEGGATFLPLHLEARGAYWFGKDPLAGIGARPFVFGSLGLAQVDTKIDVEVLEDGTACGAADPANTASPCTKASGGDRVEPRKQTLAAYKQAGLGFAGLGVGVAYAPVQYLTLNLGVRASMTFPIASLAISPEAGAAFGF